MNLKTFCNKSHLDPALIRAVVRQMGGFESFSESAQDVANHGIDGGFHGFIYYTDTVAFAKRNKGDILQLARDMADDLGADGAYSLIAGFNCLKGYSADECADAINNARNENNTTVLNALAWFAGEEVCRSFADLND